MTTIEQAKQVEQRLRKCAVTEISPWDAADIIASLIAELESAQKDAALWRAYKSRKDAVIAAGMGRNPLRDDAAIAAQKEKT